MATTTQERETRQKSLPTLANELWDLIVGYAKQETIEPLKGLRRFVARGVIGSFALTFGLLLWLLALLRALQTETGSTFTGHWSWVPYLLTAFAAGVVAILAVRAIGSAKRRARRTGSIG
ncbi:MAG TPA: hypothetical protein VFJ85_05465 [Acidimicrobiales bacterium]|nr:hypothetical protein [Acidimicrobiales bacterium]